MGSNPTRTRSARSLLITFDEIAPIWWRTDSAGSLVMSIYHGTSPIEFEKGKAGIAVPSKGKLAGLIDSLIKAVEAGELDELMARVGKPVGVAKSARRAA